MARAADTLNQHFDYVAERTRTLVDALDGRRPILAWCIDCAALDWTGVHCVLSE
jgi:hypothetical protein